MKFRYTYLIWAGCLWLGVAGCASSGMSKKVVVTPVRTLIPDSMSTVGVDVNIHIPAKAFTGRTRLIVVPQLLQKDSMLAEYTPMVFDAPIYSKKMNRRVLLDGYVDTLANVARKVNNRKEYDVTYSERVAVPADIDGGRIVAVLSTNGCGECGIADTVDIAYINNIPTLIEPKKSLQLNWIEPEFVIRPKIMEGRGEALLQFVINRYDINLSLGDNRNEMNRMLATLQKIVTDSLATLNRVSIYGMASADGSYAFNTTLSRNRANSAKNWLVDQLHISASQASRFSVGSRPEGWMPVLQAMIADGHPDSLKVREILDKYNAENDDVAEHYIRRLSCWNDIKNNYLQKDRKVEYVYTYTLKSFTTDAELLDMYGKRPDAFNEEELLRVSTLKKTPEEKKEVYRTILHYFPQSQVAANNLAVLLLREDKANEAEAVLNGLKEYSPEVLNTKAAVYVYKGNNEKAIELLQVNTELPQARYNLALLKAQERKLQEAYTLMQGYEDVNAAVVSLSVGDTQHAASIMDRCEDHTPLAEYVRALVAARMQKEADEVAARLEHALPDSRLKERMQTEPDFLPYLTTPAFQALTGGKDYE